MPLGGHRVREARDDVMYVFLLKRFIGTRTISMSRYRAREKEKVGRTKMLMVAVDKIGVSY